MGDYGGSARRRRSRGRREGAGAGGEGWGDDAWDAGVDSSWEAAGRGVPSDWSAADSDILILTPSEARRVLPLVPVGAQFQHFVGDGTQVLQRVAIGVLAAVVGSQVPLLGAVGLGFPLWAPWAQAAARNFPLSGYPVAGLWRCRVLSAEVVRVPRVSFETVTGSGRAGPVEEVLRVVVGDPGGPSADIEVPMRGEYYDVREGDPCELVAVAERRTMAGMRIVRDAYLPLQGVFLADYPYLDRASFLAVAAKVRDGG
ncbi:unnamed protein product [Pedinophyceae sp. YPF-701]|nr:unnamed protein product [Pedinophyceae sp. YPF-701]